MDATGRAFCDLAASWYRMFDLERRSPPVEWPVLLTFSQFEPYDEGMRVVDAALVERGRLTMIAPPPLLAAASACSPLFDSAEAQMVAHGVGARQSKGRPPTSIFRRLPKKGVGRDENFP